MSTRAMRSASAAASATVRGVLGYLGWSALAGGALLLRPAAALGWTGAVMAAFFVYPRFGPARWRRRRAATLRLRPPAPAAIRLALGLPPLLVGLLLLQLVYARYWGWLPRQLNYAYETAPFGPLVVLSITIFVGPTIEEFAFRGRIQGGASRALGASVAGTLGAALFAAAHWSASWLFYFFLSGTILAYLFARTRSIWTCVIVHAAVNAWMTALDPARHWITTNAAGVRSLPLAVVSTLLIATALYAFTPRPRPSGQGWARSNCRPCGRVRASCQAR